ncbi:carbon monoxide dehydrogenase subunit G [Pseudomonas sp. BIGb0450]|jgi:carbon monoxide dehydrogenase subunit G|uniref:SRPBCC family protein n=1 Tax=unclassified Pseudomonas TaxID=196821 RepID=UPI0021699474|nr:MULTISPECIES: SRPBCC family protein [unclassified Pseudomonas]MCS3415996.1 carbon monoxide dehydrogenase subunit G [Pseudomonas sp. BIGb0558]MCS3434597.1 carbon monoxide dehydrogenase subunit G [Pseudomonas sp. BIGb0450]
MKPDTLIRNPCARPVVSSVVIAGDAARVWTVVGNFAGFDRFIPALSHIEMTGAGAGSLRKKFFHDGNLVVEQLNSRDEQAMQMTWTTIYNTLGVARLWAGMRVEAVGERSSRVTWTIIAEPVEHGVEGFDAFVQAFADSALENVRQMFG